MLGSVPMTPKFSVSDRLVKLAGPPVKPDGTLAAAELMLKGLDKVANGKRISCTIDRHCHTRVFDFPRVRMKSPVPPPATIYQSDSICASLVCDLGSYFEGSDCLHYALSPSLRHQVVETAKTHGYSRNGIYPYIVIEELIKLSPLTLTQACASLDEIGYDDDEPFPLLIGGRDNERFIVAIETSDGPWPDIPNNEQTVNIILALARAYQDVNREIPKYIDQKCLITTDDQFVCPLSSGSMTARADVVRDVDSSDFLKLAKQLERAIPFMEGNMGSGHIELLANAMYWDDYKDDNFRRLHYLSLWQTLSESRKKLGHATGIGNLRKDPTILGGSFSLSQLSKYRDDIAHFWTGEIDGNYLAGLYGSINELVRRKYSR